MGSNKQKSATVRKRCRNATVATALHFFSSLSCMRGNVANFSFRYPLFLKLDYFKQSTGSFWALKMLKKAEVIRLQQVEHMISEKTILSSLDHPFIVRLAGTFQDVKFLYMVLEYIVGSEFFTHLRKAGRFDHTASKFYATQISLVFEYMHVSDFIYRDLKPENLLLDKLGFLKITDFGFAKRVAFKTYTLCGTPEYIAPEVLLNKGHGKGVDW